MYQTKPKTKNTKTNFNPSTFQNYLNSSDGVLIIHRVTNTTVGMYRCIATNDAGSSQANIHLKVTYGNVWSIFWGEFLVCLLIFSFVFCFCLFMYDSVIISLQIEFIITFWEAVVAMIIRLLDLPLPAQSVPITINVASSNPAHGKVYSIQHFGSDSRQVGGFHRLSYTNKSDRHAVAEILLKVALNRKPTKQILIFSNFSAISWQVNLSERKSRTVIYSWPIKHPLV